MGGGEAERGGLCLYHTRHALLTVWGAMPVPHTTGFADCMGWGLSLHHTQHGLLNVGGGGFHYTAHNRISDCTDTMCLKQ